jgi:hypothetical protein
VENPTVPSVGENIEKTVPSGGNIENPSVPSERRNTENPSVTSVRRNIENPTVPSGGGGGGI